MATPTQTELELAAALLVEYMRDFDPTYKMRIDAAMQERHLTPLKLCGRMFSYVLRNSLQNEPVDDLLFQDGAAPTPEMTICVWCHGALKPAWPGQRYHTQVCTQQARDAGELPPSKSWRPPQKVPKPVEQVDQE